jgi:SH3-like domain-containing protein
MNRPAAQAHHWPRVVRVTVPVVVFAATTFIFVARPLLGQRTYLAVDLLELEAPYRDAIDRPAHVASPTQGDQIEQYGPAVIMSDRSLENLEWQTWDPHVAAGTPAGVPPITANLSPFAWVFFFVPAWYAVGLSAALAIFTCQWFTYLFLRRLGVTALPAIVAGITYAFTGTNIVFINRIWAPFLLPAMLWAVHRLVDRSTFANALVLGGFVAWAWYEGFPSAWVYCVVTTAAFAAVLIGTRWWRETHEGSASRDEPGAGKRARRRAVSTAFGLAWGVALSALTLIPFVYEVSGREILARRSFDSTSHLSSIHVFGLITSGVPGPPARGPWWTDQNPYEATSYLGLAAIGIVVLGLVLASTRRLRASGDTAVSFTFSSVVAVLAIVLSYVGTPLLGLVYRLPGFANNPIWRMRFVIAFGCAILLGITLDSLWRHRLRLTRNSTVMTWCARGVLLALVIIVARVTPKFLDAARGAAARSDVLRNIPVAMGVLVVVLVAARWRRVVVLAAAVAGLAIYLELILPSYRYTPAAPISDFFTEQSGHRTLRRLTGERFRYAASGHNFSWNTSQVFGLYDLRGAALHAPEFRQLMYEVSDQAFAHDPFKIQLVRDEWNLSSPVLDDLGVRYFALGTNEMPYGSPDREVATPTDWVRVDARHPVAVSSPLARIDGIIVPLRSSGSCSRGELQVRLTRNGVTTSTRRPLYDVTGTAVGFAIKSPGRESGALTLEISATHRRCRVEMGVGPDGGFAGAMLHIDDDAPVRVASTDEAWIYERPSAPPIVTSYGRWRRFRDQPSALTWLRSRPASEAGVVSVVGDVPRSAATGTPARMLESHIHNEKVTARVDADTPVLVSAGQVVGDGWDVTVDGEEADVVLIDGGIMATLVPPGAHVVEFRYEPTTVRAGTALSGGAVLVAGVGGMALAVRRRRKSRTATGVLEGSPDT